MATAVIGGFPALPFDPAETCAKPHNEHAEKRGACCPRACGTCGGSGCDSRSGGREACCASSVIDRNHSCLAHAPPCMLGQPWPNHRTRRTGRHSRTGSTSTTPTFHGWEPGPLTLRLPALAARGSASAERIYIYQFHKAWTKKNRLGIPTGQQPWGFPLDAFGTTSASGPTYTTAVLARAAMQRTSDPANATLFLVPPPTGGFEVVDSRWCTDPRDSFSRYWQHHSTNFFERRGGADHFFVVH